MNMVSCIKEMLPSPLYSFIDGEIPPEELRMRRGCRVLLKKDGISVATALICTDELMDQTLLGLTNRSFYSHEDTIREGYIPLPGGLRAGVCGRAVCEKGRILQVKDISSLILRIPRRIPHIETPLLEKMRETRFQCGTLLYSPPGVGKTTVLRELACTLSGKFQKNIALIDCRGELSAGLKECAGLSVFLHYPKSTAISIALRTMAPDMIILDEVGAEETEELLLCGNGGVPVVASVHGNSLAELKKRKSTEALLRSGMFGIFAGLTRSGQKTNFVFEEF